MIIEEELSLRRNVKTYAYTCLNDAYQILCDIGMPESLKNARCVMVFAAFAEMRAIDTKWKNASENYKGTKFIHDFINREFPNKAGLDDKGYAENSREMVRKYTIKPWISAGILEAKPGLATNDKNNSYRFTAHFAALIRFYGTEQWGERLKDYKESHVDYAKYLKQAKKIERDYELDFDGITLRLKKSGHNRLQIELLNALPKLISKGKPELLYIGDASERYLVFEKDRMNELGIHVMSETAKLPDIILYDPVDKRIVFIEAYYTGGPFTIDRVNELKRACQCKSGTEVVFVTGFPNTAKMLKAFKEVAWDTEIWTADEPTHLVHKNGDKFIGRPLRPIPHD